MNTKNQNIIQRLVKIATKQQKILECLAQVSPSQTEAYLKRAAQVAAVNTGFQATNVTATYNAEQNGSSGESSITTTVNVEGGWTVSVSGAPKDNAIRQKFITTFKTQIQSQKPELGKNLSIILPE